jgi:DNA invertase Pin-like site-specific DNA recombinase
MVKKPKSRILGYCRCSTTEQATEGLSLDVQKSKITAYCSLNDLLLVDIVQDAGISGKSLSRPGIQQVLLRLQNDEADALVVLKLDRLSRSTRDVLQLVERIEESRWELHSISERLDTSTASGRFTITILSALAQMEREMIGERTSQDLQHKKELRYSKSTVRKTDTDRENHVLRRGSGIWFH